MSYEERLTAVLSLQPPAPTEGEVRCRTVGCRSEGRLKRTDLSCWWCGGTDIEIVSEELQVWMRVPSLPARPEPVTTSQMKGSWNMYPASPTGQQMPDPILREIRDVVRAIGEHLLQRDDPNSYDNYKQRVNQNRNMRSVSPPPQIEAIVLDSVPFGMPGDGS